MLNGSTEKIPLEDKTRVLNQVREMVTTHPETKNSLEIKLPYRTDVYSRERV